MKRRKNIGNKRVDLDDSCISLIMEAYNDFAEKIYTANDLAVESKIFDNAFFGFTKVTVETAQTDENGKMVLKKEIRRLSKVHRIRKLFRLAKILTHIFRKMSCLIIPLHF